MGIAKRRAVDVAGTYDESMRDWIETTLGVSADMAYRITDHSRRGDAGAAYRKGFLLPQMHTALETVDFSAGLSNVKPCTNFD